MRLAWSVVIPGESIPDPLSDFLKSGLLEVAALYGPLTVTRMDDLSPGETIYFVKLDRKLSVIRGGYAFGPGAADSDLSRAVGRLIRSTFVAFSGCDIIETTSGDLVCGPMDQSKVDRIKVVGRIPSLSPRKFDQFEHLPL